MKSVVVQMFTFLLFACIALSKIKRSLVSSYVGKDLTNQIYDNMVS